MSMSNQRENPLRGGAGVVNLLSNTKIPPESTGFNCLKYKDYREFSTLMPGPIVVAIATLLT